MILLYFGFGALLLIIVYLITNWKRIKNEAWERALDKMTVTTYRIVYTETDTAQIIVYKAFVQMGITDIGEMNLKLKDWAWSKIEDGSPDRAFIQMILERRDSSYYGDWIIERGGLNKELFTTTHIDQSILKNR